MALFEIAVIFVISWWLVFFVTLPWGIHVPDEHEPGHATSAPEKPRLWIKATVTTVISGSITGAIVWAAENDLFSFREMVQ